MRFPRLWRGKSHEFYTDLNSQNGYLRYSAPFPLGRRFRRPFFCKKTRSLPLRVNFYRPFAEERVIPFAPSGIA